MGFSVALRCYLPVESSLHSSKVSPFLYFYLKNELAFVFFFWEKNSRKRWRLENVESQCMLQFGYIGEIDIEA
ncbi:hypothetical protein POTOM_026447 [Populus tomentosa]|uniref:Uncharacterized protein n=1 Tax=Populus tomentosa TaxID=118781 RepID=A0A8X7ZXB1_POPTO|nr:hypothetical protein POTOM_026447 [Populus tomentosa]